MIKVYDTCALLELTEEAIQTHTNIFYISDISLAELESIKTSSQKDAGIKFQARNIVRLLNKYKNAWKCLVYEDDEINDFIKSYHLPNNNDSRIVATAAIFAEESTEPIEFITKDILCSIYANELEIPRFVVKEIDLMKKENLSKGYQELPLTTKQMAAFYEGKDFECSITEPYLILLDKDNENIAVDLRQVKEDGTIDYVNAPNFNSRNFNKVKPFKNDYYQKIAFNILNNENKKIVMLRGPQGSAKTFAALAYAMSAIEKGLYRRLTIFHNPTTVRGSNDIGFRPGSTINKMLDSGLGGILASKFGSNIEVERLIETELLHIVPFCDLRGYESIDEIVLIDEAQNLSVDMMKLAIGRIGQGSKLIIAGDEDAQVDSSYYMGDNNGMRRCLKVFQNEPWFAHVYLKNVYRSDIAAAASRL